MKMNHAWSILLMVIVLAMTAGPGYAAGDRRDGNWWLNLNQVEKLGYVTGFFDGMTLGHDFSTWKYALSQSKNGIATVIGANISYEYYTQKFFSNVTAKQLADGLDSFYSDYRNRRIEMYGAVWLVVQGIAGTPPNKLERLTESWRRNSAN